MRILHTADWHVGKTIRGRSRADEHEAVLSEIAGIARDQAVDVVIVAGDLFDTAAPTPEAERIVYRALLDLASTGATIVVVSGNHDNERRLQAVRPLLEQGEVIVRAELARADDGGVVERETMGGERWRAALIPFLSQRYVVRADDLMQLDADQHSGRYADRVRQIIAHLTAGFDSDAVNLVVAHLTITGALAGGGERDAHIFDYWVDATSFPAAAHYVALGHLHRPQQLAGPCPVWYAGSPLQLDFGETGNESGVLLVEASAGRPASVDTIPLQAGRRLRTLHGTLDELLQGSSHDDDYLRLIVDEAPRAGLAEELRDRFPNAVNVELLRSTGGRDRVTTTRQGRSPHELFAEYLEERGATDGRVIALFDRLLDDAYATDSP